MNSAIERLLSLRVSDVMRREVISLTPSQTLAEAAGRLLKYGVSGAPVVDESAACVGMLSATDFVRRLVAEEGRAERPSGESRVAAHMTRVVKSIAAQASLIEAARLMCASHVHRLPVLDAHGRVIGVISSLDLVAATVAAIEE